MDLRFKDSLIKLHGMVPYKAWIKLTAVKLFHGRNYTFYCLGFEEDPCGFCRRLL
jgi:hypothetical protein